MSNEEPKLSVERRVKSEEIRFAFFWKAFVFIRD